MFIVICPKCQKKLKVGRELKGAKLKCSACQNVFIGSTLPAEGEGPAAIAPAGRPAAPAPARPATPPTAAPTKASQTMRRAPKKNMLAFYVVCVCGVLLIPLAVGLWYLSTHTHYVQDGQDYGWIPSDEAHQLQAESQKPKPAPEAKTAPAKGGGNPAKASTQPASDHASAKDAPSDSLTKDVVEAARGSHRRNSEPC